ncbi:hypothetical protein Glove_167g108 [Diversispora epigaea]|uniref:Zinc-ribbon domain-containing protein n=1 Tax=Diversispora epigaea TaxID=1348612 RepID=A0A397IT50_9GLOM|nr:hypothetical protein Glove_167g108 [Diversispora epigaea]
MYNMNVDGKTWCQYCTNRVSHTIEDAKQVAFSKNGECLSEMYDNSFSPLSWQCLYLIPNVILTSLHNIKDGKTWCQYCTNRVSHTIEDAKQVAFSKNGECLSEMYDNSFSPLSWRCSEGPYILEDAKQLVYNRKGACLSEYNINNGLALLWMCDKKHKWFATFNSIKHSNSWYPFCPKYKREKLCHEIKTKVKNFKGLRLKKFTDEKYPNGLELGIFYLQYGFAIEVQGIQHEKYHEFFHGRDPNNFIKQQAQDQLKKELCEENWIALRYVWYYEDPYIVIPKHLRELDLIELEVQTYTLVE